MISAYLLYYWSITFVSLYLIIFWLLTLLDKETAEKMIPKRLDKFPLVSIAIPAYNEESRIEKTIISALELDYPQDKIELFVMDDGSKDNTKKVVEKLFRNYKDRKVHLISKSNRGKGEVMNEALKLSNGKYFVVFDADSTVSKDALKKMLPYFDMKEDVVCVLPAIRVRDPKNSLMHFQWIEYMVTFFYKYIMDFVDCIPVSPGPFSVYVKKEIEKLGGFDEKNLTEDLEMSLNIQKNHKRILQNNDVIVYTTAPETWKALYKQRNRWYKGGFYNSIKYRSLIFNKQYGDFGLLQFPAFLAMGWLILALITAGLIKTITRFSDFFRNFFDVNFDILYFLKLSDFQWWRLEYTNLIIFAIATSIVVLLLVLSLNHHKEKLFKNKWVLFPMYLVVYGMFITFVWLGVLLDLLRGKKQRW